jgi:hypothetical protein
MDKAVEFRKGEKEELGLHFGQIMGKPRSWMPCQVREQGRGSQPDEAQIYFGAERNGLVAGEEIYLPPLCVEGKESFSGSAALSKPACEPRPRLRAPKRDFAQAKGERKQKMD